MQAAIQQVCIKCLYKLGALMLIRQHLLCQAYHGINKETQNRICTLYHHIILQV